MVGSWYVVVVSNVQRESSPTRWGPKGQSLVKLLQPGLLPLCRSRGVIACVCDVVLDVHACERRQILVEAGMVLDLQSVIEECCQVAIPPDCLAKHGLLINATCS